MNGDCSDNYTCQEVMNHFILSCWSYFKAKNLALIFFFFLTYIQKAAAYFSRPRVKTDTQKNLTRKQLLEEEKKKGRKANDNRSPRVSRHVA